MGKTLSPKSAREKELEYTQAGNGCYMFYVHSAGEEHWYKTKLS
jgi:hypothetical protein